MQQSPFSPFNEPLEPDLNRLVSLVKQDLLPQLQLESLNPYNPVVVHSLPASWQLLGAGNYAAVVAHPDFPEQVVKVYAPGRPGLPEEVEVYRRLGSHPAFSACRYAGESFLVLQRLHGVTLYDCLHRGLPIPEQVIAEIDQALDYARSRGLFPHDVHGRNVMMHGGHGLVVDVSDFLHHGTCRAWEDLKRAYYRVYVPLLRPLVRTVKLRVPYGVLDGVRQLYRLYRRLTRQL